MVNCAYARGANCKGRKIVLQKWYFYILFSKRNFSIYTFRNVYDATWCTGAFLDISQAFDRVWHTGLLSKLKLLFPSHYYLLLKSYLEDRFFSVRIDSTISSPTEINAGVPQGVSVIAPLLFNFFISNQPTSNHTVVYYFADDEAILNNNQDPNLVSSQLQDHLDHLETWYNLWRVKMNESLVSLLIVSLPGCCT